MRKKITKAFLGPIDVANIANSFFSLLKYEGIHADYYTYSTDYQIFRYGSGIKVKQFNRKIKLFSKNITSIINLFIKYIFLIYLLLRYNTFFFISPHTILPSNSDLKILKYFNKKIIFLFVGCVDRDVSFLKDDSEYICNRCTDYAKQKFCLCDRPIKKAKRVRYYEKYSDYVISQDDSAGYLFSRNQIWLKIFAKTPSNKNYLKKYNNKIIRIVHFPSNPKIKLSHLIIPVLEELQKNYSNIEVVIQTKIPHKEVLKELEEAHIVVDALGLSYGMLAVEAMARACVVIAGDFEFVKNKIPDIAVIGATSLSLYSKIEELIINKELLFQKANDSLTFFEKHHSFKSAGKYYKNKLNL